MIHLTHAPSRTPCICLAYGCTTQRFSMYGSNPAITWYIHSHEVLSFLDYLRWCRDFLGCMIEVPCGNAFNITAFLEITAFIVNLDTDSFIGSIFVFPTVIFQINFDGIHRKYFLSNFGPGFLWVLASLKRGFCFCLQSYPLHAWRHNLPTVDF